TKREAAVIGTTFSVVSITFTLVVIEEVNLQHMFVPFYLTVLLAGFVAALIMPRIPPLSKKSDSYVDGSTELIDERIPEGQHVYFRCYLRSQFKAYFCTILFNGITCWFCGSSYQATYPAVIQKVGLIC